MKAYKLEALKLKSFMTSIESRKIQGGTDPDNDIDEPPPPPD